MASAEVRLVIGDTGPVNYLALIGHIDLLSACEKVILLSTVHGELNSRKAPPAVRQWMSWLPSWLEVRDGTMGEPDDASLKWIDAGERAAIQLAVSRRADLLLMDDRRGVKAAEGKAPAVTGTLGVLDLGVRLPD